MRKIAPDERRAVGSTLDTATRKGWAMGKTREEREEELILLLHTEDGRQVLQRLLHTLKGIPEGTALPAGTMLVQDILAIGFPKL